MSNEKGPAVSLVPAELYHALTVAHAEIARLRLTDEEREAVECATQFFELRPSGRIGIVLRSLLERLA